MMFENRLDAARRLAEALSAHAGSRPLVLAIPRGAVPMGAALAEALDGELDVVLVHKLGSRWNAEYAVGAIDESGWSFVSDPGEAEEAWLEEERARRLAGLRERRQLYSPGRPPVDAHGRTVIIVDDGLATGATMIAALHAVRAQAPAKLICAVPVAAPDSLKKVEALADEVVCLHAPWNFRAVGQFYREFGQVEDEEVVACLEAWRKRGGR
ncbi:MAG: phosphoribosyltransferase [Thauera phenolivorans]|uniref:Phosphoribosyltransferase n=1 Tax=Thauera phenolivorans TaxID=1792543 RepID=A0A7X7R786_9RHOO|nr:phosphoribosyltransferase family protein [Thauera phenolivorans]NLF53306.1 phosphoribosyltransferase [Thauera phenolivorans]